MLETAHQPRAVPHPSRQLVWRRLLRDLMVVLVVVFFHYERTDKHISNGGSRCNGPKIIRRRNVALRDGGNGGSTFGQHLQRRRRRRHTLSSRTGMFINTHIKPPRQLSNLIYLY